MLHLVFAWWMWYWHDPPPAVHHDQGQIHTPFQRD